MRVARRVEFVGGTVAAVYAVVASLIVLFVPHVPVYFGSGTSFHLKISGQFQALGGLSGIYYAWPREAILLGVALVFALVVARTAWIDSRKRSWYARIALWIATAGLAIVVAIALTFPTYFVPYLVPSCVFALVASIAAGFMLRPQT